MKPFLGIDHTTDKKNTKQNSEELFPLKPSADLEETMEKAAGKAGEALNKAKLPLAARIVSWICHFTVGVLVIGVIRSLGGEDAVTLTQILENAPWIFIVGGVALVIGLGLHLAGNLRAKRILESDESKHSFASLESLCDSVYSDLGVPENAREVDLISVAYKEKDGEIRLENSVYNNPIFKVFADKDYFYLANFEGKFQFSRESARRIHTVKKSISFKNWNKDDAHNGDRYKKYRINVDKYGRYYCKPYHILEMNVDGKLWGIYFPSYELPLFEALTGLKAE